MTASWAAHGPSLPDEHPREREDREGIRCLCEKEGVTRGAFFETCYHAFTTTLQGDENQAFLLQAMVKLHRIAKFESKARARS